MAFGEPNFDALLTFLLVASVLSLVVKALNRLKRRQKAEAQAEEAAAEPEPEPEPEDVALPRQIRDAVTSRDGGTAGRAG